MREFTDAQGRRWTVRRVHSVAGTRLPDDFREGWLLFTCDAHALRLAPIPADWERCPLPALLGMLGRAQVTRRTPGARQMAQDDTPVLRDRTPPPADRERDA